MVIVLKPHVTEVEIALIKRRSHVPMIVDLSHGTGKWHLASPMALAEVAVGADGIMVAIHSYPEEALSEEPQTLAAHPFEILMNEFSRVAQTAGRSL